MKLDNKKGKGLRLQFDIHDGQTWYVNTLRRLAMSDVPVMAIELVEIRKNDSILYDEMIAHRLGLIPLATDLDSYKAVTDEELESQEYLAQSSCKLTLKAKGPCVVLAKDFVSKDPKVKPIYPDMPITKLLEGQELELEATAVLGRGKEHAKWSPCHAHYAGEKTCTFMLESWGQLKPDEIINAGVEEFNKQLKEFETLIGSL